MNDNNEETCFKCNISIALEHGMCDNCLIKSPEYCVDSYTNGNLSQARELYKALSTEEKAQAITYAYLQNGSDFDSRFVSHVTTEESEVMKLANSYIREERLYQAQCEDIKERGADLPYNYGTRQCEHGVTITEYDCDCVQCEEM